jgi:hypothetical protein
MHFDILLAAAGALQPYAAVFACSASRHVYKCMFLEASSESLLALTQPLVREQLAACLHGTVVCKKQL